MLFKLWEKLKLYKNPGLGVGVIAEEKGKALLGKRNIPPFKGKWEFPAGYVGYGEKVEDAAIREFKEETGYDVELQDLIGAYSDPKRDPRYHSVLLVFSGKITGGSERNSVETQELAWRRLTDVKREEWAFDYAQVVKDYAKWKKSRETFWSSKRRD